MADGGAGFLLTILRTGPRPGSGTRCFVIRHPPSAILSASDLVPPLPSRVREEGAGVALPLQGRGEELDEVAELGLGEELDDVLGHRRVAALLLLDLVLREDDG